MESVFILNGFLCFYIRAKGSNEWIYIGEMDLILWMCEITPSDILLFMTEKLFKSEKKDVTARHGITLGCCGIYVHFSVDTVMGNLTYL